MCPPAPELITITLGLMALVLSLKSYRNEGAQSLGGPNSYFQVDHAD